MSTTNSESNQNNTNSTSVNGIRYIEDNIVTPTDNPIAQENYNQGYMAFQSGDYLKAIKHYTKAIELDPNYIDAYDNCGLCYRRMDDLDSAANYYKESIRIFPKGRNAHINMAFVYLQQGLYENAIKEYEELSNINPNDPEGPYGISSVFINAGLYDQALEYAKIAADLFEKYQPQFVGDAYYYIGLSYLRLNDKKMAIEFIQKAIENGATPPEHVLAEVRIH